MKKYTVAQAGCGRRGEVHLDSWLGNSDRFTVVGVCDIEVAKARRLAAARGLSDAVYDDADRMLAATKPDVFCFSTLPHVRLSLVELAVKHGVKALVFEKPMATSLNEAHRIAALCRKHGIKAVVSHQQKYLTSFTALKSVIDAGGIGDILQIEATCQAWLSPLGTHYVDYALWVNGGRHAKWVVGHVHGKELLGDVHPSPNYTFGQIGFENGVRAFVQFGRLAPAHMGPELFWADNRLTVRGTHGHVWCDTNGRWGGFNRTTKGEAVQVEGETWDAQEKRLQVLFVRDLACWLDDPAKVHPCNIDVTLHGYEILEGICISALDHRRVDLPLGAGAHDDVLERMRRELPDCPELPPTGA